MERKADIIKSLEMMGYSVSEDDGGGRDIPIATIGYRTKSGRMFFITLYPRDFEQEFIVETVVAKINEMVSEYL